MARPYAADRAPWFLLDFGTIYLTYLLNITMMDMDMTVSDSMFGLYCKLSCRQRLITPPSFLYVWPVVYMRI